ncbi:hypothetical protein BB737_10135 [Mycobacterium avium subsp. hominissuis]|uniref:Uncharacterized protein n=3 Tax=Mycobacterium TaxID=1763 RepID=A0AA37Q1A3_9MYCO|nr:MULTISPECIES: hypothetical protein [Mycobacterium]APA78426.1 hypothetical protein KV38_24590 [Mycobacterium avium subsp. hominissuis]PBJ39094.1 hypothetical protein XV03_03715 [Mycobacterium avium subsp. hominissuis]PBJ65963.1 hypothetical protein BB737_10135 [Mycobacterium avium subsp. hominissuis]GLB86443.1 hypothetical protein SRL2020028_56990 [Mycobacterium kiyosense]
MSSDKEYWEQWCGSTVEPVRVIKKRAKVFNRDGQRWITYPDEIKGKSVIVEMPQNAPTKSCHEHRHDDCPHRLGGPQEGGVLMKISLPGFTWRCGCPCHRDPHRAGRLF